MPELPACYQEFNTRSRCRRDRTTGDFIRLGFRRKKKSRRAIRPYLTRGSRTESRETGVGPS